MALRTAPVAPVVMASPAAAFVTSEVEVTAEGRASWDSGFDAHGRHVWGAESGPHIND